MEQSTIRELSTSDLLEKLETESKQYRLMKINHTVSPIENPNKLKEYRKIIARLKTELRKREIENSKK